MTVLNMRTKTAMGIKWSLLERGCIKVALFSYIRAFGDRPRNLEPWSSDEDDACAGTPPLLTTAPAGGRLSSGQIQTHDIPATSLSP
ncbi:hypothetical protein TNCV_2296051 [Trichonephila clavipes]|nr:hypothetical protein TNCV_2296051 [Trichonephila clavipes]